MKKKFHELRVGDFLWDMHNGYPDFKELIEEKVTVESVSVPLRNLHDIIGQHLSDQGSARNYMNKMLVVIAKSNICAILAYSYDDRRAGFFELTSLVGDRLEEGRTEIKVPPPGEVLRSRMIPCHVDGPTEPVVPEGSLVARGGVHEVLARRGGNTYDWMKARMMTVN